MKKLSDTYAELKKSVAYKKRVSVREMVLMVETILVKIKMTKKLDGINIIMQEPRTNETTQKQHRPLFYIECHLKCSKKS